MRRASAYILPMIGNSNQVSEEDDGNPKVHQKGRQNQRVSETKRIQIAFALGNGLSQRATASLFHVSSGSVSKIACIAHGQPRQSDEKPLGRSASEQIERHLVCYLLLKKPRASYRRLVEMAMRLGVKMSHSKINRLALQMGFESLTTQRGEKLNVLQRWLRQLFSNNILLSTISLWPWIFTDESMICINPRRTIVKILKGMDTPEKYDE